ncbi:hypothetical protein UPYG_G00038610 [Umbra pygmaea]|uniref:Reelin domain-containing protein n=1 Tax=Umbra pygmaea TaxID=75934 RepID=A0ABD0XPH6_UMBPY
MCFVPTVLFIGFTTIGTVTCFSGGGVSQSCQSMMPDHSSPLPSSSPSPFSVKPEDGSFENGEMKTIVLQAETSTPFKGFLLEARESQDGPPVGVFTLISPNTRLLECNGYPGAAVTQKNNQKKTLIQANWTSPKAGTFYFRVTFIQDYSSFCNLICPSLLVTSLQKGQKLWHCACKILCSVAMAAVIIAFITLLLFKCNNITLFALVGVAMVLRIGQTIIIFLTFGPSQELRVIFVWVLRVIALATEVFLVATIFVGLAEIEKNRSIHWPMKVMGGYVATMVLFYCVFIHYHCNHRKRTY